MTKKSGRSEEKETWYGTKYTQHYDSKGKESGTSVKERNWLGEERVQHYEGKDKRSSSHASDYDPSSYSTTSHSTGSDYPTTFLSILAGIGLIVYLLGFLGVPGFPETIDDLRKIFNDKFSLLIFLFLWILPVFTCTA